MRADRIFLMRQQLLRVIQMLGIPIVLLALSSTAVAQIEPALPGSIEYSLISNNQSWIGISDPIDIGSYVQDLLTDRLNQPAGRATSASSRTRASIKTTVRWRRRWTSGVTTRRGLCSPSSPQSRSCQSPRL